MLPLRTNIRGNQIGHGRHQDKDYLDALSQHVDVHLGLKAEGNSEDQWVEMSFLIGEFEYFARWLLGYTNGVKVLSPEPLTLEMNRLIDELQQHYQNS